MFFLNEVFWANLSSLFDPISSEFFTVVRCQLSLIGLSSLFANTLNASSALFCAAMIIGVKPSASVLSSLAPAAINTSAT